MKVEGIAESESKLAKWRLPSSPSSTVTLALTTTVVFSRGRLNFHKLD